jgi:protein O-mannosyl-transferase
VLLGCLLLVALAAATAHWTALSARAISFDDNEYLIYNPVVKNPSWASAGRFLSEVLEPSTVHGYYQPLTMISLMLDCAMGGRPDNLMPFHRTSLILHVVNTALVVVLLYQLFGNPWAAACVGLLFGVHPITVETIPWIGERKTLLAAFFALLSLIAYVRYTRTTRHRLLVVSGLLYILALMSKPTSTPLPLCMLLLDFWPLRRLSLKAALEKAPFLIIAAVSAYITYESQKRTAITVAPGDWGDPWRVPLTVCHNIIFYLRQFIWPVHLSSHYPLPWPIRLTNTNVLIGVIGTAILIPGLLLSLLKTRTIFTGWAYFFVMIFPAIGVIGFTNVIAADKFAYLPAVGLMLPLTYGLDRLWRRGTRSQAGVLAVTGILAVVLAVGTRNYLCHWEDTESLFKYMIEREPEAATLHFHLASELGRRADQAARDPMNPQQAETARRYREKAVEHYRFVIKQVPTYEDAHNNLGIQLFKQHRVDEAIACYRKALDLDPKNVRAMNNLANALFQRDQYQAAEDLYRQVLELKPDSADAHYNLANLQARRGDLPAAIAGYERALALDPNHLQSIKNLAGALLRLGRVEQAVGRFDEALRKDPDSTYWGTISNLAWDLLIDPAQNPWNVPAARQLAEMACRATEYRQPAAIGALAAALAAGGDVEQAKPLASRAVGLANASGQIELAVELQKRLSVYLPASPSGTQVEDDNRR